MRHLSKKANKNRQKTWQRTGLGPQLTIIIATIRRGVGEGSGSRGTQRSKRFKNFGSITSCLGPPFLQAKRKRKTAATCVFRPPPYEIGAPIRKRERGQRQPRQAAVRAVQNFCGMTSCLKHLKLTEKRKTTATCGFMPPPYEVGATMRERGGGSGSRGNQRF